MEITYDYYRVFYYVATQGSFTGAAMILGSNQPNVTKTMNNLEAQIGCKLFVRTNRGVRLTAEGERLFVRVAAAYEQLHEAEREMESQRTLQSGTVNIAASETALHGVLLPALREFHHRYPAVRLRVSNHSTPQALSALQNGTADFAVVTTPTDAPSHFHETALLTFQELLVSSVAAAQAVTAPLSPSELLAYPVVGLGHETKTHAFYTRFFARFGLAWKPDTEAATADQMLPLIENGLGIGFVPDFMTKAAVTSDQVVILPVAESVPLREVHLVEDSTRTASVAANEFKQLLLAHAAQRLAE
ncbi:MAG: LysR family transcriptional regulator [Eubacteriales bacterium]|nr:LysR family transcriptional regulator [Eubacteriales bacterium]